MFAMIQVNESMEYEAPSMEMVCVHPEFGVENTYGDYGEAGGDIGSNDNGEF